MKVIMTKRGMLFKATLFSYIVAVSLNGGGNQSTRINPPSRPSAYQH